MQQCFGTRLAGYRRRGCLIFFIFFDLLCMGLQVPLVAVLAAAGLPVDCHGIAFGKDPFVCEYSPVCERENRGLLLTKCIFF